MLCFYNILPWLGIEIYFSQISQYPFSFYRNIVCKNVSCDVGIRWFDFRLKTIFNIARCDTRPAGRIWLAKSVYSALFTFKIEKYD